MLYFLLRNFIKIGLQWYIADVRPLHLERAKFQGPTLILSNHPNSFFDALLIAAHAPEEIHYLVRGDIFRNPIINVVLRSLYMLPIYKKSDDPEHTIKNEFTYDECVRILRDGKHVLIFPEGKSHNLWYLQQFMKNGLSALLERSYKRNIPIQIQPYALNYNSFLSVPKSVSIEALYTIDSTEYIENGSLQIESIIALTQEELKKNMPGAPLQPNALAENKKKMLFVPAKIGYYTQYWFYKLWKNYIAKKTQGTIFYDSLLFGALLFSYPIFVLLVSILVGNLLSFWWGVFVFMLLPATSYCMSQYQHIKVEADLESERVNYF
ncbi:hypothetical protein FAZ15_15875 [Sphingobacterium olei]|uniref:Phospholipid/glycerol acyltransferase domain-containing protein n=1 Tax=Sphingobacterium olei TaxID=2571155 RepID=A0A4U0NKN6_9SPHI|nr:1-acyl-sn-glycerol-3-phosphate acyltransferase [Sphingobacterium olei]TJZ54939.1 hypothetical protein FAZ15_15875 [Sphingobacterium olei]